LPNVLELDVASEGTQLQRRRQV